MNILKYNLCTKVNHGTDENPVWKDVLFPVTMGWNEANEEIAKLEAYNGEYTIEDDGAEEETTEATLEDRVGTLEVDSTEMKEALDLLLSGVTE